MLRITFRGNRIYEYLGYIFADDQVGLIDKGHHAEYYPYNSILKIEKLVKELSYIQINQYAILKYGDKLFNILIDKDNIYFNYRKDGDIYTDKLVADEYVDITDVIFKGVSVYE